MADVLSGGQKTEAEQTTVDDSPVAQLMGMKQDKITRYLIVNNLYVIVKIARMFIFMFKLEKSPSYLIVKKVYVGQGYKVFLDNFRMLT